MSQTEKKLFMAIEMSNEKWLLCFSEGEKLRKRNIKARERGQLLQEVQATKEKFKLSAQAKVISCYEAGRDGFWVHRFLEGEGIENRVLDPASIEVSREGRRRKTDRLDAEKLVRVLMRLELGQEKRVCRVVRVPSPAAEDAKRLHRERERLGKEVRAHRARMQSLLVLHGIRVKRPEKVPLASLVDWAGKPLAEGLVAELEREGQRLKVALEQFAQVEKKQAAELASAASPGARKAQKLTQLCGIGIQGGWVLGQEFFWREFGNRKEVGSCAGLTGSPYQSGNRHVEQGISKAGNWRVRALAVELAWSWLRFQPQSELSQWFVERYGKGGSRMRRVGIVALARKLLVALWKYLESGEAPPGALLKSA